LQLGYADVDDILSLSSSKLDEWMEFYKEELWDIPFEIRAKFKRQIDAPKSTASKAANTVTKDQLKMLSGIFGGTFTEG